MNKYITLIKKSILSDLIKWHEKRYCELTKKIMNLDYDVEIDKLRKVS